MSHLSRELFQKLYHSIGEIYMVFNMKTVLDVKLQHDSNKSNI